MFIVFIHVHVLQSQRRGRAPVLEMWGRKRLSERKVRGQLAGKTLVLVMLSHWSASIWFLYPATIRVQTFSWYIEKYCVCVFILTHSSFLTLYVVCQAVKDPSPEELLRQLQEERTCKVCMDKLVSIVFIPCGHLVVCGDCAASLRHCPICRAVIRGSVRAFMSWRCKDKLLQVLHEWPWVSLRLIFSHVLIKKKKKRVLVACFVRVPILFSIINILSWLCFVIFFPK